MKIIAHRGNLNGPNPHFENNPIYLDIALDANFDIEIDVWKIFDSWYLGHDEPQYLVPFNWFKKRQSLIWIHCKNYESLEYFNQLNNNNFNYFWHETDNFTLTSKGFVWTYPKIKLMENSICVLPEKGYVGKIEKCYAVCTDFAKKVNAGKYVDLLD
jgi:hypothetical protein